MKGSYWFKAKSKKVLFEFSIRRNITVIKGDSATGKTTLLRILYEYLRIGRQSGYAVSTNASYYVYIRDEVGRDWKDALYPLKNTVIFIEEAEDARLYERNINEGDKVCLDVNNKLEKVE